MLNIQSGELQALRRRVQESDPAPDWDVAPAESEGPFTDRARAAIEAAEAYFDNGGEGIAHEEIVREIGIA